MKLVLDTNIALDWLLFNDPATDYLREQIASKQVLIVTHAIVVDELKRVLAYSALKLPQAKQREILTAYTSNTWIAPMPTGFARERLLLPPGFPVCRDPDDQHFLALTHHAKADALMTRDKALLKLRKRAVSFGVHILTARAFTGARRAFAGG